MSKKVSDFDDAGALTGDELIPVVRNGVKKTTLNDVKAFTGGGGGAAAWGNITGDITDQTDLVSFVSSETADGYTAFSWGNHADEGYLKSVSWGDVSDKPADITLMGNDFNGVNQLVKLDGSGKLPAIDGSQLTGIEGLPAGGTIGQTLTKQSAADGDADWKDLPTEIVWKADKASFPLTGEDGKAYVARDTGLMYRWDTTGSEYVLIGGGTGTPYIAFSGTNTYTSTNTPSITSYPKAFYGVFANANTGSSTVKIDALSALPVKLNGKDLVKGNILSGSVKLFLLASDSSHYQLQAGFWEIPAVASGENVVTVTSSGLKGDVKLVDGTNQTPTTGLQLSSQSWTPGSPITYTGNVGEYRYWGNYKYECTADDTWWRTFYNYKVVDMVLDTIDDSGGVKTSAWLSTQYPTADYMQIIRGSSGLYQFFGAIGWFYFENKIAT